MSGGSLEPPSSEAPAAGVSRSRGKPLPSAAEPLRPVHTAPAAETAGRAQPDRPDAGFHQGGCLEHRLRLVPMMGLGDDYLHA